MTYTERKHLLPNKKVSGQLQPSVMNNAQWARQINHKTTFYYLLKGVRKERGKF